MYTKRGMRKAEPSSTLFAHASSFQAIFLTAHLTSGIRARLEEKHEVTEQREIQLQKVLLSSLTYEPLEGGGQKVALLPVSCLTDEWDRHKESKYP